MEFKERLKALRKEKKLTQGQLAEVLSYGYTAISNYESGRNEPSIEDLKKIAKYFNVSMDYLLCVNDEHNPFTETKDAEDFSAFRSTFMLLTGESKEELKTVMDWILEKQTKSMKIKSRSNIYKVAEPKAVYKTKKDKK